MIVYYKPDYIRCDCGSIIKKTSEDKHLRCNKHIDYMAKLSIFKKNYSKEYTTCPCGTNLRTHSLYSHRKSQKHKQRVATMENDVVKNVEITF